MPVPVPSPTSSPGSEEDDPPIPDSSTWLSSLLARLHPFQISASHAAASITSVPYVDLEHSGVPELRYLIHAAGRKFLVGIEWSDGSSVLGTGLGQAREDYPLDRDDPVYYVSHPLPSGSNEQYGLIPARFGATSSGSSLAQLLAQRAESSSFIGLFELDDGSWYYIVVRDGVIRPRTDLCVPPDGRFDLVAQARNLLAVRSASWDHVFAPAVLNIDDSKPVRLHDLLEGSLPSSLRYLYPPFALYLRYALYSSSAAVLIGALWFGYSFATQWFFSSTDAQQAVSRVSRLVFEQVPEIPPAPWEQSQLPLPVSFMDYCLSILSDVRVAGWSPTSHLVRGTLTQPIPIGGYSLSLAECSDANLVLDLAPVLQGPDPTVSKRRVHWVIPIETDPYSGPLGSLAPVLFNAPASGWSQDNHDPFRDFLASRILLFENDPAFRFLELKVSLGAYIFVSPKFDPSVPAWATYSFSITGIHPFHDSERFRSFLSTVPGLLVEALHFSTQHSTWKLDLLLAGYTSVLANARLLARRNQEALVQAEALDLSSALIIPSE